MELNINKFNFCPHNCHVDRTSKKYGVCGAGNLVKVAKAGMHYFEEPCISGNSCGKCGKNDVNLPGSGTVFFSNCNLKCVFCQNHKISQEGYGVEITVEKLADIFLKLQSNGAYNINLVSPTIYVLQIIKALDIAKSNGLNIPVIYNSSGYEKDDTIELLNGYIDVYLPDFKYFSDEIAFNYSKIKNYFECASKAILKMYKQVGNPIFDNNGIIKSGLIIRHMILPNNTKDTKNILKWVCENLGNDVYISVMAQYFPTNRAHEYEKIDRKINKKELEIVKLYIDKLGFKNGYIQKLGKHEEEYVPDFNLSGIF